MAGELAGACEGLEEAHELGGEAAIEIEVAEPGIDEADGESLMAGDVAEVEFPLPGIEGLPAGEEAGGGVEEHGKGMRKPE
jgi:hypothetical protein